MFIALFDKDFRAIGSDRTTYYVSSWSLTRRAYEMDSFTATCAEIANSAKAMYVGFFEKEGKLRYLALSGMPKNEKSLTKVTALDIRRVFLQKCWMGYSSFQSAPAVKAWVSYLLNLPKAIAGGYLGIDYSVDVSDFDTNAKAWVAGSIASADGEGDVWEELQAAMMRYGFTLVVEGNITTDPATGVTSGSVAIAAKVISKTHSVKLKDFDHARVVDESTDANRALAKSGSSSEEYWIVNYPNGDEAVLAKAGAMAAVGAGTAFLRYPARYEIYSDDDFAKARASAQNAMEKNRYKGSVELSLDVPLGKELRSADLWSRGQIYGYNAADDSTARILPMMWIREDSNGSMSCCFGRLDDYYYL